MEKKYSRGHIGKTFTTNKGGYKGTVVDGGTKEGYSTVTITGNGHTVTKEAPTYDALRGSVSFEYHNSVYGKGYIGVGKYKSSVNGKEDEVYTMYHSMMSRGYSEKFKASHPSYEKVTVNEELWNFQDFAEFVSKQTRGEGFILDKDLLSYGNKEYSKDTILFIPKRLNSYIGNKRIGKTTEIVGVSVNKHGGITANIRDFDTKKLVNLGKFNSVAEAGQTYLEYRSLNNVRMLDELITLYEEGVLDIRVIEAFKRHCIQEELELLIRIYKHQEKLEK